MRLRERVGVVRAGEHAPCKEGACVDPRVRVEVGVVGVGEDVQVLLARHFVPVKARVVNVEKLVVARDGDPFRHVRDEVEVAVRVLDGPERPHLGRVHPQINPAHHVLVHGPRVPAEVAPLVARGRLVLERAVEGGHNSNDAGVDRRQEPRHPRPLREPHRDPFGRRALRLGASPPEKAAARVLHQPRVRSALDKLSNRVHRSLRRLHHRQTHDPLLRRSAVAAIARVEVALPRKRSHAVRHFHRLIRRRPKLILVKRARRLRVVEEHRPDRTHRHRRPREALHLPLLVRVEAVCVLEHIVLQEAVVDEDDGAVAPCDDVGDHHGEVMLPRVARRHRLVEPFQAPVLEDVHLVPRTLVLEEGLPTHRVVAAIRARHVINQGLGAPGPGREGPQPLPPRQPIVTANPSPVHCAVSITRASVAGVGDGESDEDGRDQGCDARGA
mmetsp:Transcript_29086/g.94974  ORF Transcript_29086/g.94974 Transcript_29086/m.94974 type:complete len:442 (-) Transcript_29086:73-1398(-)